MKISSSEGSSSSKRLMRARSATIRSKLLGVGAGLQSHFDVVAVVVERLHQVAILQVGIALILHLHVVLAVAAP